MLGCYVLKATPSMEFVELGYLDPLGCKQASEAVRTAHGCLSALGGGCFQRLLLRDSVILDSV